jgi:hypothetical protein
MPQKTPIFAPEWEKATIVTRASNRQKQHF